MYIDVVNNNNLNKFNNSCNKGVWLVWFFADWCGHCRVMNDEWNSLVNNNVHGIKYARVRDDFNSSTNLNSQPNIQGYPTIILYKDGEQHSMYTGLRNEESLNEYIANNTNVKELNSAVNSGINSGENNYSNHNNSNNSVGNKNKKSQSKKKQTKGKAKTNTKAKGKAKANSKSKSKAKSSNKKSKKNNLNTNKKRKRSNKSKK